MPLPEPVALPSSACAGCGGALADDARFCPSCGTPRQAPEGPPPDERRLATVVIGDLVGFTALAETLDPERVKQLVDRLFGRLAADVAAHGGTVDKVVGDSIVALFGAPVAHEDDPERAVRAALAMQRTVRAVAVEEDVDLQMRIGVNTGEVLVGGLVADDSWTAMGDAVNVAARLESAADPGAVLVGEQTHRATQHRITFRRRGPLTVRGRREPLDTWVALRPIGEPGSELDRRRGPVVGREVEERFLDAILDVAVARRRAHLVELIGDAGVGKRMLADAFVERARQRHDALVLEARIPPYGEASMWTPAADMLRNAVGLDIDLDDEAAMTTVVAGAMGMSPDHPEAARMASALHELMELSPDRTENVEAARAAATAAIVTLVRQLAERRPIVAVLANIQWADQAIIDLMTDVLMGLRRLPVMAVTTSRVGNPTDHVPDISAFTDAVNVSWLRLGPLEDDDARALARELLGPAATDEAVSAAVRRSGGNPLMLEEIAALADEGVRADRVEDMPLTLRGLLSARLDVLDPAERRIVEDAAMIGWTGPVDMLLAVATDRGEREAAALLEVLVDRDLFVIEGDTYRFKTDALREAAYLRLPKRERVERHRDIGRRLAHPSGGGTTLRRRAQHLATAAELAASMGPVADDLRTDAVEALDAAAEWAGQRDPAVSLVFADRAIALADDAPWTIRLHRARALAELGRIDEATAAATAIVDADPSAAVTALALVVIGQGLQSRGRLEESTRVLEEAVAAARRSEDEHALATALRMLGMTLIFRGMEQPAARAVHEAGEVHERLGDVAGMAWAEQHEAWIAFNAGDLARASLLAARARDRFAAEGNRLGTAFTAGLLGWIDFLAGDLDGAMEKAEQALSTGLRPDTHAFGAGLAEVLLAGVHTWQGRTVSAAGHATEAIRLLHHIGHRWGEMLGHAVRARALAHLGRAAEAAAEADRGVAIADRLEDVAHGSLARIAAAGMDLHQGEPRRARSRLPAALTATPSPDIDRHLALAALQEGDTDTALVMAIRSLQPDAGPSTVVANSALAALVHARAGDVEQVTPLVDFVEAAPVASYLDRTMSRLAAALAAHRRGLPAAVRGHLDHALGAVGDAQDIPARALVTLLEAALCGSPADVAAAIEALPGAGITGDGWLHALGITVPADTAPTGTAPTGTVPADTAPDILGADVPR